MKINDLLDILEQYEETSTTELSVNVSDKIMNGLDIVDTFTKEVIVRILLDEKESIYIS